MTAYLRDHSYSLNSGSSRRKIKHFSYLPSDRIGKGYSSVVYKGKDDNTDETVAIKAIDMKGVKDSVSRQMLDCEIQALTILKHSNILRCHEVVRQSSHCYIITEFCSQGDLTSLLKKKRRIPEADALSIIKDILNGYIEIGDNNFLHRDLKLANILLNEKGVAKIADFGFAKKSFCESEKEKYNVGSPLYMSPQALKRNIYSVKNDIWSIGIMVYEMLYGETPWDCKSQTELIDKMTKIPVRFKSTVTVSENLKDFIRKCLEVNQYKRLGLTQLKQWLKVISHPRSHSVSEKHAPLQLDKRFSNNENVPQNSKKASENQYQSKPLGDLTNRIPGVEKVRSYSNVGQTKPVQDNRISKAQENKNSNKENVKSIRNEGKKLSRAVIENNNELFLVEINKFRLMFKIYEKLKKNAADEKTLHTALGSDILKRVDFVADLILRGSEEPNKRRAEKLGLQELEMFTADEFNSGIRKYVAVIKEYQRKYQQEIDASPTSSYANVQTSLQEFLTPEKINQNLSKEQNLLYYWIYEFINMSPTVKKKDLDSIIEAKKVMSSDALVAKLKVAQ